MSSRIVTIPSYSYTRINKDSVNEINDLTPTEIIHRDIIENIKSFDKSTSPDENAIYIFAREKMDNGNWRYAVAAIPTENNDSIIINFLGFKKLPSMFLNVKDEVIKVVKKVINNLAFI